MERLNPAPAVLFALLALTACGWRGHKRQTAAAENSETTGLASVNYTVEDTVRMQLGGKLFSFGDSLPDITPKDSITVIETRYCQSEDGELYREYGFIVHDFHSRSHRDFEPSALDKTYSEWEEVGYYGGSDSLRTEYIDPAISKFNGYWLRLTEHGGDWYFGNYMGDLNSFHIADSIVTKPNMDGLYARKILKAVVSPDGGLSLTYRDSENPYDKATGIRFLEPFDRAREIYRCEDGFGEIGFVIPARAVHNVEFIRWANTTGDVM